MVTLARIPQYILSTADVARIAEVIDNLGTRSACTDDAAFLDRVSSCTAQIPEGLRSVVEEFRTVDRAPALLIRGWPIDQLRVGNSPTVSNRFRDKSGEELTVELAGILVGSLLGDVFGWRLQHDGSIVHDLVPRREHEDLGLGTGSRQHIDWHTEDSFHPHRADYLGLFCVRNAGAVPTMIGFLDVGLLSREHRRVLAEPHFTFRPDPSYSMSGTPPFPGPDRGSVLFGDFADPYLRFDQDYVDWPEDIDGIDDAVAVLREVIDASLIAVPLRAGDFLMVNNRRAVHGRPAFAARYLGRDRWVKRLNITDDSSRFRSAGRGTLGRVIYV